MVQSNLIAEINGGTTIGYGESKAKYYAADGGWSVVLLANGKKCGRLVFDTLDQMVAIQRELGKDFRVVPK